jgi:hypothetical protein
MIVSHRNVAAAGEAFAACYGRLEGRAMAPGRLARVTARVRSASLDRALIDGADPVASPALAARAAQLTSPPMRSSIAEGLERLVRAAQRPQRRWWAPSGRQAVLANSSSLHELAATLHGEELVYARGVAILAELLTDGTGPAYGDYDGAAGLARELRRAGAALAG